MARIFDADFELQNIFPFTSSTGSTSYQTGNGSLYAAQIGGGNNAGSLSASLSASGTEVFIKAHLMSTGSDIDHFWSLSSNVTSNLFRVYLRGGQTIRLLVNGTIRAQTPYTALGATWYLIEAHLVIGDSVTVTLRVDGVDYPWTGDTKPGADASFASTILNGGGTTVSSSAFRIDNLSINDTSGATDNSWIGSTFTRGILPDAAGANSDWTPLSGANYTMVDEAGGHDSDTTYVSTVDVDDVDFYNLGTFTLPAGTSIMSVRPEAVARKTASEVDDKVALGVLAGTTEDWDTGVSLGTGYGVIRGARRVVNPDTSAGWTQSDIDAVQAGIKATS